MTHRPIAPASRDIVSTLDEEEDRLPLDIQTLKWRAELARSIAVVAGVLGFASALFMWQLSIYFGLLMLFTGTVSIRLTQQRELRYVEWKLGPAPVRLLWDGADEAVAEMPWRVGDYVRAKVHTAPYGGYIGRVEEVKDQDSVKVHFTTSESWVGVWNPPNLTRITDWDAAACESAMQPEWTADRCTISGRFYIAGFGQISESKP